MMVCRLQSLSCHHRRVRWEFTGILLIQASKFGIRGFAEALQHEVIADNIRVSLIFPPDTETPGLEEENKTKPQLTSIIAGSSGAMKADDVAKKAISGIQAGSFIASAM